MEVERGGVRPGAARSPERGLRCPNMGAPGSDLDDHDSPFLRPELALDLTILFVVKIGADATHFRPNSSAKHPLFERISEGPSLRTSGRPGADLLRLHGRVAPKQAPKSKFSGLRFPRFDWKRATGGGSNAARSAAAALSWPTPNGRAQWALIWPAHCRTPPASAWSM